MALISPFKRAYAHVLWKGSDLVEVDGIVAAPLRQALGNHALLQPAGVEHGRHGKAFIAHVAADLGGHDLPVVDVEDVIGGHPVLQGVAELLELVAVGDDDDVVPALAVGCGDPAGLVAYAHVDVDSGAHTEHNAPRAYIRKVSERKP